MQVKVLLSQNNTDLKLLKTIAAYPFQWQMPKPQNVQQLVSLLKSKNQSVKYEYNQIQSSRNWLIHNGINIGSIYKDLQTASKQSSSQQQVKNDTHYYHLDLSAHSISEYFNKTYQNCTFNLIQHVMNTNKQRDRFIYKQIDRMMNQQGAQRYNAPWKLIRNMNHKEIYLKIVSQVVRKQKRKDNMSKLLLKEFQQAFLSQSNNNLWKIVSFQLEKFSQNLKIDQNLERMFFKSLKLIEQQFQLRLCQQDIEKYVKDTYLDRVYEKSLKNQLTWVKAWLYMMSGLHNQAIAVIQTKHYHYRQFIQAYIESSEAIRNHKPIQTKLLSKIRINDVFYDQMIICLNGQTKFSNKKLFEIDSLELVWLIMRTSAIFWNTNIQKRQKFIRLRSQMAKKYRNYVSNPHVLRYMLYMLDYESIISMGESMLDKDELLHFLIVLQDFSGLIKNASFQKMLSEKLTIMIKQLMIQRKEQYIYYIALMPTEALASNISKLIVAFYTFEEFNWQHIKQFISKSAYQGLVKTSIDLYAQKSRNYYECGMKLIELLGQVTHVIHFFIRILIKHHLDEKSLSIQQIQQIQQKGLKLSTSNENFMKVFQFFSCVRLFNQVFDRQGSMKMQTLVTNNLLVFIDKKQAINFIQVLQQIKECSGVEIYYNFIRNLVGQAQIYYSESNNKQEFRLFKRLISNTCLNLLSMQTLKKHRNHPKVQQTINYLQLNS